MDLNDNEYGRPNQTIQHHHPTPSLGAVCHLARDVVHHQLCPVPCAGHDSIIYKMPFVVLGGVMTCIMLYRCLYLYKLRYIITSEQLIIQHGVLTRTSDYIELYRVVDFSENRDILEQLFGLKTVWIFSGDRSNPKLDIYGVKERLDVMRIIRERVEYNKKRKGIYEITNR